MGHQYHIDYQKAILLNNTAVYQIENGHYEKACNLFQHALRTLHNSKVNMRNSQHGSQNTTCGELGCKRSRIEIQWSRDAPLHSELNLLTPSPDTSYIFRRALFLTNRNNGENLRTTAIEKRGVLAPCNMDQESKGIIYNLGLSYLLSGFVSNNSVKLKKARQLFEKMVHSILNSSMNNKNKSSNKDYLHSSDEKFIINNTDKGNNDYLLETAVYNNMGWLDEEFCDFHLAQVCYNEVFHRMEYLIQNGFLKYQECEGFMENIERVDLDNHLNAAAAA